MIKGCVGALDGTWVTVRTSRASQRIYRTRKGTTAINIFAACNPNTKFIYTLDGWKGSAHDSRAYEMPCVDREGSEFQKKVWAGKTRLSSQATTPGKIWMKSQARISGDYKVWSKLEEQTLVKCMRELVENHCVQNGACRVSWLEVLEFMLHERLEGCQFKVSHIKSNVRYLKDKFTAVLELKHASGFGWDDGRGCVVADDDSHPNAKGMNNKPLPCFDDLSFIFGVDLAIGDDAIQPGDAASILKGAASGSDFMDMDAEVGESYNIPDDLDHTAVMQDIINKGIDLHATGL
ncbi:hypothetical protein LINGRAHAP2_LOCUS10768 [Linum grandiflorum]